MNMDTIDKKHKSVGDIIKYAALIIGVIVIPLFYSYFYLGAFWDPYSTLDELPVAVVNEDQGATINGTSRNLGYELVARLQNDNTLGWVFTDEDEALEGVTTGDEYYAMITIPADFSQRIASAETADKQAATLNYTVNEKRNFLASQILNRAVLELEEELRSQVNAEITGELALQLQEVPVQLEQLNSGLNDLLNGMNNLSAGMTELNGGTQQAADSTSQLSGGTSQYVDGVNSLIEQSQQMATVIQGLYNSTTDEATKMALGQLLQSLSASSEQLSTLAASGSSLTEGMGQLSDAMAQLSSAAGQLQAGSGSLSTGMTAATESLTSAIDETTEETASLDGLDTFSSAPVSIEETEINPVPNYGTAFAPYFMSLSLWVGALVIFVGIYLDPRERIKILSRNSKHKIVRLAVFTLIAFVQTIALAAVVKYGLNLTVANTAGYYLSCMLISITFLSIVQFLMIHLNDIGKFLSILLLILQLTACGGTFPMELLPGFFNALYPYMPMTYSVNLFKEAISGLDTDAAWHSAWILIGIWAVFTLLTIIMSVLKKNKSLPEAA
jgi:putative membrane protein